MKRKGNTTYLLPLALILGLSIYLVGGTNKLQSVDTGVPRQQAIPKSTSSSSNLFGQASTIATNSANGNTALQVGAFPFVTVTPTPITGQAGINCDSGLQRACAGVCQKEVDCTKSAADPNCPNVGYRCLEQ